MAVAAAAAAAGVAAGLQLDDELDPADDSSSSSSSSSDEDDEEEEVTEGPDTPDGSAAIPYSKIYKFQSFENAGGHLFLAGQPVIASIQHYEHFATNAFLSPYLYFINLKHGSFKWIVTRTYTHFAQLHKDLNLFRTKLKLSKRGKIPKLPKFPKTPDGLLRDFIKVENRKKVLEKYIQNLLKVAIYREHHDTVTFLEVCRLSFLDGLGPKFQEGTVKKLLDIQSMNAFSSCSGIYLSKWKRRWLVLNDTYIAYLRPESGNIGDVLLMDKDFVVKHGRRDTGINHGLFMSNSCRTFKTQCSSSRKAQIWQKNIEKVLKGTAAQFTDKNKRYDSFAPIRANTRVSWFVDGASYMSAVADALETAKSEIFITDWKIVPDIFLKAETKNDGIKWRLDQILKRRAEAGVHIFILIYKELPGTVDLNSKQAKAVFVELDKGLDSEFFHVMRHPDGLTNMKWSHHEKCVVIDQKIAFVGGLDLCEGRWDTSDHLLRYNVDDETDVFDQQEQVAEVLQNIATQITNQMARHKIYKRSITVPETSSEMESVLRIEPTIQEDAECSSSDDDAEENVPPSGRIYYSPSSDSDEDVSSKGHEGFIIEQLPSSDENQNSSPNEEFTNIAKIEVEQSFDETDKQSNQSQSTSNTQADCQSLATESNDNHVEVHQNGKQQITRQPKVFMDRFLKRQEAVDIENKPPLSRSASESEKSSLLPTIGPRKLSISFSKLKEELKKRPQRKSTTDVEVDPSSLTNKDEFDYLYKRLRAHPGDVLSQLEFVIQNSEERWTELVGEEDMRMPWHDVASVVYGKAARDVARHFIQRWNFTRKEKEKLKKTFYPIIVPKTYCKVTIPKSCLSKSYVCNTQILRSSDKWSAGLKTPETSIQNAYESVILNAKHYVYIENQFFISCSEHPYLQNRIAAALCKRIIQAHEKNEIFRVYVILPLMPVVKGKAEENITPGIQVICYWTYESISRSENSIIKTLKNSGVSDPSKYISFYGLRKWYEEGEKLTSMLVYVHSKILIADDRTVIIGSANINDRSMVGSRDSELAIVFNDTQFFTSKMNSEPYEAGNFATTLRRFLFKEHLGIKREDSVIDLKDPVCDNFYRHVWIKTAQQNTQAYDKMFRCLPSDRVKSFHDLEEYKKQKIIAETRPKAAKKFLKDKVRGQLVTFPLDFLVDSHQDLKLPPLTAKERLVPTDVWI